MWREDSVDEGRYRACSVHPRAWEPLNLGDSLDPTSAEGTERERKRRTRTCSADGRLHREMIFPTKWECRCHYRRNGSLCPLPGPALARQTAVVLPLPHNGHFNAQPPWSGFHSRFPPRTERFDLDNRLRFHRELLIDPFGVSLKRNAHKRKYRLIYFSRVQVPDYNRATQKKCINSSKFNWK